jgi:hypothetical protein
MSCRPGTQAGEARFTGGGPTRWRAYAVAMHFSVPELMSLLTLINPESSALWRTAFAIAAIGGAVVLTAIRSPAPGMVAYVLAIVLYVSIAIMAVVPRIVGGLGLDVTPVRADAVLLVILVFAGVNVAWLLLFDEAPSERTVPDQRSQLPLQAEAKTAGRPADSPHS